jgi:rod shape-determining protein MreB
MSDSVEGAIVGYLKRVHRLAVGERMVEQIKASLGAIGESPGLEVRGRDMTSAQPRKTVVTVHEIRGAVKRDGAT